MNYMKGVKSVRKFKPNDTFGTIFHLELMMFYKALEAPDVRQTAKLVDTLKQMQATGIKTVVYSISWQWAEPEQGKVRTEYISWLLDAACKNTGLQVDLIVDLLNPPDWMWRLYPDARPFDSDGRNYTRLSWFHPLGNKAALTLLGAVATHLATNYPGCAKAIQPVYNNEYEAKYTQEYDSFQDYGPYALGEYRRWLQAKTKDVHVINLRWGKSFKTWDDVRPPRLHSGDFQGVDFSAEYWDFVRFREEFGAAHYNRACATVHAAGLMCFHHFPEFFTVIDAMYGATMFRLIASSPFTDFVIMDSNFMTPYGTVMNPHKLRVYISAAHAYGKPVYFEAAVERFKDYALLEAGFYNSLLAGADNIGITNWHTRVDMNASLAKAMTAAPTCGSCELVGVFLHLQSCAAYHGLQWQWARKDPLHDMVEELAEKLHDGDCGTDIAVYIELDKFLADMGSFSRAVFVEPLVLWGTAEMDTYIKVKSALEQLPHTIMHMPTNVTSGPQLMVLADL
ncbi:hypothetical protein HXX76_013561 [Chlamydomonas incerta]|uniref:Glycoside hydrolase family 42 N-terminal domain-containing protein n=1 Tax=Chlamydomonas incerta TaxID=51695 RepID=A0A835SP46_CHLIN|nr:hypothetical protein HXX76_013561 [Chlamydomonas incerta]|eukprot:KAG2425719.1 hypothetical protein HXX76_013561 [Chlamydomonas incerta]